MLPATDTTSLAGWRRLCHWDTEAVTVSQQQRGLLDEARLEQSTVVANCAMNRDRRLSGVNSYARELGFNPLDALTSLLAGGNGTVAWLDLCCGSGRALEQAARELSLAGLAGRVVLVGVDLVDTFVTLADPLAGLELVCVNVASWQPARQFDLITCVHGLHYVGDKLALVSRAASWLTPAGRLVADLDLAAVHVDGRPGGRVLAAKLRAEGFAYDARRHMLTCAGHRLAEFPYTYLGADDRAGPGYTGQPAVCSHYATADSAT